MSELLEFLMSAYGPGFFYLFTIPAVVICAIVLFEICDSALAGWRERQRRAREGDAEAPFAMAADQPLLHVGRSETALRKWHYRPLDRQLTQPFAKQVNRPVSDAYRWG